MSSMAQYSDSDDSEDEFDYDSYESAPSAPSNDRLNIDLRTERRIGNDDAPFEPPRRLMPSGQDRTGPKGVIADFEMAQRALVAKKRLSALRYERRVRQTNKRIDAADEGITVDDDDEFAGIYARVRDKQSLAAAVKTANSDQFVVVHAYSNDVDACLRLHLSFEALAERFTHVRFLRANVADVMPKFDTRGLPALLIYRNGEQIESALRVTDALRADFTDIDVARLLQTKSILMPSQSTAAPTAAIVSSTASTRPSTAANTAALSDDEDDDSDGDER